MDSLDREFQAHLVFVFNQVTQHLRKTGWSKMTLERVGKLLFRLYQVFRAYKAKKIRYTLPQWLERISTIGKDLQNAFSG